MPRKNATSNQEVGGRTQPISSTIHKIRGYGSLTIFQMPASPFWWARYYHQGKIAKRSLKTKDKREATKLAIAFFAELTYRRINSLPITKNSGFEVVARSLHDENVRRAAKGEIAQRKIVDDLNRLQNDLLPYFGKMEVQDITYRVLGGYDEHLISMGRKLSSNTLKLHYSQVRSILRHAQRLEVIKSLPPFPKQKTIDKPRPWFNPSEYVSLRRVARKLVGQSFQTVAGAAGKKRTTRQVHVTVETYDIIVFMINTFIRPTDLKVLKHKHVTANRGDETYLLLNHPPTKGHSNPVVSMPRAVGMYERIVKRRWPNGEPDGETYVFKPDVENRDYALRQMEREFDEVLRSAGLKVNAVGESRSLYSLRHTAISFRILKSDGLGIETLASNARTSIEMIDRFYASPLRNEMQVAKIQSFRRSASPKIAPGSASRQSSATPAPEPKPVGGTIGSPQVHLPTQEADDWDGFGTVN